MHSTKTVIGAILIGSVAAEGAYYLFRWIRKKRGVNRKLEANEQCFHDVLFFPDQTLPCRSLYIAGYQCHNVSSKGKIKCRYTHEATSLSRMMNYLNRTTTSLDLCLFILTCPELADSIVTLYKRGVTIRVITDSLQVDATGSQIGKLRAEGIPVRSHNSSYLMHHKFGVADNKILINGSFNWTTQAISGNNENVLVTNSPNLVTPYREEFDKLWNLFDPRARTS